jgi:hypothetical protein
MLRVIYLSDYGACQMPVKSTQSIPCMYIWDWDDRNRLDHKDQLKGKVVLDQMYQWLDQMYQWLEQCINH